MTQGGVAFELPMQEHLTVGSESSSSPIPEDSMLRTPSAIDGEGGAISEKQARERNRMVQVRDQVAQLAFENGLKVPAGVANSLLPTVTTQDAKNNGGPSQYERNTRPLNTEVMLLPTTTASDWKGANHSGGNSASTRSISTVVEQVTQWGKFEPAIRRWEQVTGRPAPAPTKPDGKDDAHRLSSKFTEWMMGLPDGWITDHGLTRNEELKMAGNGVCPQQAELAIRTLLLSLQHDTIGIAKEGN
jgi:hypothetical protein